MDSEKNLQEAINHRFKIAYDKLLSLKRIDSKRDFCANAGINEGNFQKYYTGARKTNNLIIVNMTNSYNISPEWMLTGEEPMFRDEPSAKIISTEAMRVDGVPEDAIPLYDIDINAGNVQRLIEAHDNVPLVGWLHLEDTPAEAGLLGVRARGDSMATFINGGDVMLIKRIEDREFVPPGHAYVVISTELSVVKYIRNGSTPDKWVLRSHNDFYEDFEVSKSSVKHLFIVVKVLKELTY